MMKRFYVLLIIMSFFTLGAQERDYPRPWTPVIYTNTTVAYCEVRIDGQPAVTGDEIAAFVDDECRGVANVVVEGNTSFATMNIQGDIPETVYFAVWDQSEDLVCSVEYSTQTNPGGDIGYPPNLLPIYGLTDPNLDLPPVSELPAELSFDEDTEYELNLNSYITDPEGEALNYQCIESGDLNVSIYQGMLSMHGDENYFGDNEVIISASDGENTILDTILVHILSVNDAPMVFVSEDFTFEEDTELYIDLSIYVTDVDSDTLEYFISNYFNVNIFLEGSSLTLSAVPNWNGIENLMLFVSDGTDYDMDNFLVTVTPVNDPPEFSLPAEIEFDEDSFTTIELSNYASDVDGDEIEFSITDISVELEADLIDNVLEITSEENWHGSGFITLEASDPFGLTDTAVIDVIVNPVNDAPQIFLPEEIIFDEDTEYQEDFSNYVSDIDGDELSLIVNGNIHIQVEISDLMVIFDPFENWFGSETIQFTVNDENNRAIAGDQVDVIVMPVNDAPEIDLPPTFSFLENTELVLDFNDFCNDPDGDALSVMVLGNENVLVNIDGLDVILSASGWYGNEDLQFTVTDGEYETYDNVTVEVLENSELPSIILPQMITIEEDMPEEIDFGAFIFNDEGYDLELDAEGNNEIDLTISSYLVNISSAENWSGEETVTFNLIQNETEIIATDETLIRVNAVNDAPQLELPDSISFAEDTNYIFDCNPYIFDPDNTEFTLSCTGSDHILATVDGLNITIEPEPNYFGIETFTITVNDNSGRAVTSDELSVIIEPVNDPPEVAFPEEIIFNEDTSYILSCGLFALDIDDEELFYSAEIDIDAELIWQEDVLQIVPQLNFNGSGLLLIGISDEEYTVHDTLSIQINPVNDAPVIDLPEEFVFDEDTMFSFDVNEYAYDADGDNLFITYSAPFFVFITLNGSIIELEMLNNWNGQTTLTVNVDDGQETASDEVNIIVNPINDAPVLNGFSPEETELLFYGETAVDFSVNVYDNDSDLTYMWYINSEIQPENTDEFAHTFTDAGNYLVEVVINDEEYQLQHEWELEIYMGPGWEPVVYTNSTICYGIVTLDGEPAEENDLVGAFVNGECRGVGEISISGNNAYTSFLIQGVAVEMIDFQLYSANNEEIYNIYYSTLTNPGGDIGYPPDLLPLAAYTQGGPGWIASEQYESYTSANLDITIDGEMADASDVIAAFSLDGECLGVGEIIITSDHALSSFEIWQDEALPFTFRIWNADQNEIYYDESLFYTDPGGFIGETGDEVLVDFSSDPGPGWITIVYTNSTTAYCQLRIDGENLSEDDLIGAFVDNECRGIGEVFYYDDHSMTTIEIQGEAIETCSFRLWDSSEEEIYVSDFTIETNPGGNIGYPPDELEIDFWSYEVPEFLVFPRPWNVVYYTNTTVAYGRITIDDQPVASDNEIAAFIDGECRGTAYTVFDEVQSIFTMNIQGDTPEPVQFNYYDVSEDQIYSIEFVTQTAPGGDIGYPPDLLPLAIYTNFPPDVNLPEELSFDEDVVVVEDMSEYITDPDGDELTLGVSGNSNINIEIEGLLVTAWGNENWFGSETIDYSVDDGNGHIVTGEIILEVLPVNDAPDVSLPYSFTLQEDQSLQIDFSIFISDVENDPWQLSASGQEFIAIEINGSIVDLMPENNWNGTETITFYADDGEDIGSDSIFIIVNSLPDAPIVDFPDQLLLNENESLAVFYPDHIYDPDGDPLEVTCDGSDHITALVTGDSIFFIPETDWFGIETVTVNANDNTSRLIGSDDVDIVVEHVHQPPVLELPQQFMINEDETEVFDLTEYFTIFEGDDFIFSVTGNEFTSLVFEEAQLTLSADENWFGTETVVITLDDEPSRLTVSDTVDIVVVSVNDEPSIAGYFPEINEFEVGTDSTVTFWVDIDDIEGGIGYTWYLNSIEQPVFDSIFVYTFAETGEFEVQCMAFDEEEELYVTWNVTVIQVENSEHTVSAAKIFGNYPNPFNPETTISFQLLESNLPARLQIYNSKGQLLSSWNITDPGYHEVRWNAGNQPSGIYFYSLKANDFLDSRKLLLLK